MSEAENSKNNLNDGQTQSEVHAIDQSLTDIDDIFDQSVELNCDKEFANKQYDKYVESFYNAGFREALTFIEDESSADAINSEEHALQSSFDKGYETAFTTSRKLSTLISAVKTYIDFLKENTEPQLQENLRELESLNLELDAAKLKLNDLVKSSAVALIDDGLAEKNKIDTNITVQQRIANLDEKWCSKLSDTINLPDLQTRCNKLLDINV